jgi:acyl dehydratase
MIDYETIRNYALVREQSYSERDAIVYALGIGLGDLGERPDDLRFVYEKDLQPLPTFAAILGYPGMWIQDPALGLTWSHVLNGEQGLVVHRQLPSAGKVTGHFRIVEVVDKGPGKGALIYTERDVIDAQSQELLATVTNTIFARADGGFPGGGTVPRVPSAVPARDPELSLAFKTLPQGALIYRLSGDYNPLHADPDIAHSAGFSRPILHGAATWGVAGYALMSLLCGGDPSRFRRFNARLSAPVYPGETIRTDVWQTAPGRGAFQCKAQERDVVVLSNGEVIFD